MNQTKVFLILFLIPGIIACTSSQLARHSTYYIDSDAGNDLNPGTSPDKAWKTLVKINRTLFHAGDSVLLRAGRTFKGSIRIDSLFGTAQSPVVFSTYGKGKAFINSGDSVALRASGCHFLLVKNIVAKGSGRLNGNNSNGIEFFHVQHGSIDSVEVSGYLWSGIQVTGGNNFRITNVFAHDNGFCGINIDSKEHEYGPDGSKYKTVKNVYVAHCIADNNPGCPVVKDNHSGNGILLGGVVNGLVEYCEARNNGWDMPREGNGPVGIWAYMCDSIIIQHCYSHHNKTSAKGKDGGGFDLDGGVTNSIMQYNLSAFNEGAGYGIFQYAGATEWSHNIARYNISFNDGSKNSHAGIFMWCDPAADRMRDFHAYNNTIVSCYGLGVNFDPGAYQDFVFENNIFLITSLTDKFIDGKFTLAKFRHNAYWASENKAQRSSQPLIALDKEALIVDPGLHLPNSEDILVIDVNDLKALSFFKLQKGSACIEAGRKINPNGGKDFFGNSVKPGEKTNIGADGRKLK